MGVFSTHVELSATDGLMTGFPSGYCYLLWFEQACEYGYVFDRNVIRTMFGEYPKVCAVLGYLYACGVNGLFSRPEPSCPGIVHVDRMSECVDMSVLISVYMFSSVRIGAMVVDDVVSYNERVREIESITKLAGVDMGSALQKAASAVLTTQMHNEQGAFQAVVKNNSRYFMPKEKFMVPYVLSAEQIGTLQRDYPGMNVVVTGVVKHPHAFAAAARMCAEEYVLRTLGYKRELTGVNGMFLVDVGANVVRHAAAGRFNIHGCVPILDVRDSARETERKLKLERMVIDKQIGKNVHVEYVRGGSLRCFERAECCNVKAPYMMLLHAQYDISMEQLGAAFDMHGTVVAYSVIMFDPIVLVENSGVIAGLNVYFVIKDGRITFKFVNDSSMSYSHKYSEYVSMLSSSVLMTPAGNVYVISREDNKSGQLFIKFTKCEIEPECAMNEFSYSYWMNVKDEVVLSTWEYDDSPFIGSKFKVGGMHPRFKRKYVRVSRRLYELIQSHCLRSGDKSFNMNEIYSCATSYNTRMTINGVDVRAPERVDPLTLMDVVVAVYCISYRYRYKSGKVIERYSSKEKRKRVEQERMGFFDVLKDVWMKSYSGTNVFVTWWNNLVDKVSTNKLARGMNVVLLDNVKCLDYDEVLEIQGKFVSGVDVDVNVLAGVCDGMTMVDRVCGQVVSEMVADSQRFGSYKLHVNEDGLTDELVNVGKDERGDKPNVSLLRGAAFGDVSLGPGVVECTNVKRSEKKKNFEKEKERGYVKKTSLDGVCLNKGVVSNTKVRESMNEFVRSVSIDCLSGRHKSESVTSTVRKMRTGLHLQCDVGVVHKMPGSGQCVFEALKYHLRCFDGVDVLEFKKWMFEVLTDAERVSEAGKLLLDVSGSKAAWGTSDHVSMFSALFGVNVCVHVEMVNKGRQVNFVTRSFTSESVRGDQEMIHLKWRMNGSDGHVDVLCVNETKDACVDLSYKVVDLMRNRMLSGVNQFNSVIMNEIVYKGMMLSGENEEVMNDEDEVDELSVNNRTDECCVEYVDERVKSEWVLEAGYLPYFTVNESGMMLLHTYRCKPVRDVVTEGLRRVNDGLRQLCGAFVCFTSVYNSVVDDVNGGVRGYCGYKYKSRVQECVSKYKNMRFLNVNRSAVVPGRVLNKRGRCMVVDASKEIYSMVGRRCVSTTGALVISDGILAEPVSVNVSEYRVNVDVKPIDRVGFEKFIVEEVAPVSEDVFPFTGDETNVENDIENDGSEMKESVGVLSQSVECECVNVYAKDKDNDSVRLFESSIDIMSDGECEINNLLIDDEVCEIPLVCEHVLNMNDVSERKNYSNELKSSVNEILTDIEDIGKCENDENKNVICEEMCEERSDVSLKPVSSCYAPSEVSVTETGVSGVDSVSNFKQGRKGMFRFFKRKGMSVSVDSVQMSECLRLLGVMSYKVGAVRVTAKSFVNVCEDEVDVVCVFLEKRTERNKYVLPKTFRVKKCPIKKEFSKKVFDSMNAVELDEEVSEVLCKNMSMDDVKLMRMGSRHVLMVAYEYGRFLQVFTSFMEVVNEYVQSGGPKIGICVDDVHYKGLGFYGVLSKCESVHVVCYTRFVTSDLAVVGMKYQGRKGNGKFQCQDFESVVRLHNERVKEVCERNVSEANAVCMLKDLEGEKGTPMIVGKDTCVVFPALKNDDKDVRMWRDVPRVIDEGVYSRAVNAMLEFRHVIKNADEVNEIGLKSDYEAMVETVLSESESKEFCRRGVHVYDCELERFLCERVPKNKEYMFGYDGDSYVMWKKGRFQTKKRYVCVTRKTEKMLNYKMYCSIKDVNVKDLKMPKITWVNGVPGCGKTTYLVKTHTPGRDLILSASLEGINAVREKVKERCKGVVSYELKRDYRTLASVLINGVEKEYERVFVDEALMVHVGMVLYVVHMIGCKDVWLIGDVQQIPYIDRTHVCEVLYSDPTKICDVGMSLNKTYRCPMDVVYALSSHYRDIVGMSEVCESVSVSMYSGVIVPKFEGCLYMTYLQADKDVLLTNGYGDMNGARVLTVNEAQGLTFKRVIVVRLQNKPVDIFDDVSFAIVAISRHTESFTYYSDVNDALKRLCSVAMSVGVEDLRSWMSMRREKFGVESVCVNLKLRAGYECVVINEEEKNECVERVLESVETSVDRSDVVAMLPCEVVNVDTVVQKKCRLCMNDWLYGMKDRVHMLRDGDVWFLQMFYDDRMPGVSSVYLYDDQNVVEASDVYVNLDKITISVSDGMMKLSKYDKLRPVLNTIVGKNRKPSQKESVLGLTKRNLNVPKLHSGMDERVLGEKLFKNFRMSVVSESCMNDFELFKQSVLRVNGLLIGEWFKTQKSGVDGQSESEVPLHERSYNRFDFMVKPTVKPALVPTAVNEYLSVQTIAYNSKAVNVVFCPIFKVMRSRLLGVLKSKVKMFVDMSTEDYERSVNECLRGRSMSEFDVVEVDFSKYDKSQALTVLWFERMLYLALGMDVELVEIWYNAHRESVIIDRKNGVRVETDYQRKSGDASTFFGNTVVLLAVLTAVYDVNDIECILVAGDDSLVFLRKGAFVKYNPTSVLADLFNMECKLLRKYVVPYFCSKFLVEEGNWVYLVPDVVKIVAKLGRRDMTNWDHVEEYRISCVDAWKVLNNEKLVDKLDVGINERYLGDMSCVKVLRVLCTLVRSRESFRMLYVRDEGVKLNWDPSRAGLGF